MADYWIREAVILAGGRRFTSNDLDIEFDVPFDNEEEPDIATATIYNLAESSINSIEKASHVIINAGYKGDVGTIFAGTLQESATSWQGLDKPTKLTIGDGANEWLRTEISRTYAEGIQASAILRDMTGLFGLEIGRIDLVRDLVYPKGRVVDAMLKDAIKQIVRECDSSFKISGGKIFIMPHHAGIATGFVLNKDTGLIGSPEVFEREEDNKTARGFKVKMLLNHRITVNSLLQIQSQTANGLYRVTKGRHTSGNDFTTSVEVVE